jgi:sugar phosphate isomerase/epimerase
MQRQEFLRSTLTAAVLPVFSGVTDQFQLLTLSEASVANGLKTSLNAYSFNAALTKGTVSLDQLLEFCAAQNFEAVDITGYYFKSYPAPPPDSEIFAFKRKAHKLGVAISGTGVRNDFTTDDPAMLATHIAHVKAWIEVAAKLGAPVLRIFSGLTYPAAAERYRYTDKVLDAIRQCLPVAAAHGVILAMQNHFDFIRRAEEAISLVQTINSPWLGLVLDIGSYRGPEPFEDIRKSIPYAVNWQVKEQMYVNEKEQRTDLRRLFDIIKASGYRGYLPIETLGPGDPFEKVPVFLQQVRQAMNA